MAKQYAEPQAYEAKLEKVMSRLQVEKYDYDWSRFECWVSFQYKGQAYRFTHSVQNAKDHGVNIRYGSDVFAQVVLSLEDLARMVERGIYDLSTWVAGMQYLPEHKKIDPCFTALGFSSIPESVEDIKAQYKCMAKVMHPDAGGSQIAFERLTESYNECLRVMGEQSGGKTT